MSTPMQTAIAGRIADMGDCKDNMKKTGKNSVVKAALGMLPRKKPKDDIADAPRKFADVISEADEKIGELVAQKTRELADESDKEYNSNALAMLKTIQWHIDEVIDKMADYGELRNTK